MTTLVSLALCSELASAAPKKKKPKTDPAKAAASAQKDTDPAPTTDPPAVPPAQPTPPPAPVARPVSPEPPADAAGRDTVASPARSPAHRVGQNLFEVAVGVEGGMRRFNYTDGLSANLRPYHLDAAPLMAAAAEVYPLAGATLIDVGAVLGYARAFALQSTTSDAGAVSTLWQRYSIGAHARMRTGSEDSPLVGLAAAYGDEEFAITSSINLPSVDYRFVRTAADVRVPFGRAAAFADAGYLFVLSAGDVAARFPRASVGGVEAELGGAFTLAAGLEARVTASYRRFFYVMNPIPGDGYVAGGALDELAGLQASVAYVY
jgi:hypothetical protein